jgi:antitoxin component of RelBE/YafQ-DinJ toxin-antitoxin module
MSNRTIHVRIPAQLDAQLAAFCASYGQTPSTVIRGALAYALARPGLYAELCTQPVPTLFEEARSPEQIRAWDEYSQELETFDMQAVARALGVV